MNFSFLIQARMGSTRFPGKALEKIYKDQTLIDVVYRRVKMANFADDLNVVVLTTQSRRDDRLVEHLVSKGIPYYRGDEENVYKRYKDYFESISLRPDYFFRICGDNPFIEPNFLDDLSNVILHGDGSYDYFSHKDFDGKPSILTHYGFFGELIRTEAFMAAREFIRDDYYKQHVTPVFYKGDAFDANFIEMDERLKDSRIRLTFDTEEDLVLLKKIIEELDTLDFTFDEVIDLIKRHPEYLTKMKENIIKNEK